MKGNDTTVPIPRDVALKLCNDIRQENSSKWFSFAKLQCLGCYKSSKGDPDKMCFSNQPDYRGCNLVNACYKREPG